MENQATPPPRPRPEPRRVTRARPDVAMEPEGPGEAVAETHDDPVTDRNEAEDHTQEDMVTPKSSARRTYEDKVRTPENPVSLSPLSAQGVSLQPSREPSPAQVEPNPQSVDVADGELPVVTPKLSRKRPRTRDDYILGPELNEAIQNEESAFPSPAGDLQIRRKRIRH